MTGTKRGGNWSGRTHGGLVIVLLGFFVIRFLGGERGTRLVSFPISFIYLFLDSNARRSAVGFWRHLRPELGYAAHVGLARRQLRHFGLILCDRRLFYRDPTYRIEVHGQEHLHRAANDPEGALLLSAHVGNWELASRRTTVMDGCEKAVHIVRVFDDPPLLTRLIEEGMEDRRPNYIDPRDPVTAGLAIQNALAEGGIVCMLGDRRMGARSAVRAPFLDATAPFPIGPFLAAGLTRSPIFVCFLYRIGPRRYRLEVDPPWYVELPRGRRERRAALQRAVERWARRLERQVRRSPLQWQNFYDFWDRSSVSPGDD